MRKTNLILAVLILCCFCLSMQIQESLQVAWPNRSQKANLIQLLLGDSRRLLGDRLFTRADIYFHSGFYRSNFGRQKEKIGGASHMAGGIREHAHDEHCNHDKEPAGVEEEQEHVTTLAGPRDWIEAFGQKFYPAKHTHLDQGGPDEKSGVQEILPWLKLSAAMDPNRIETYTVSAYWLSQRLNKPKEAKAFLREGLRANPGNPAILFELSRLAERNDTDHAINLLELAERKWQEQEAPKKEPNTFLLEQIYGNLARLEIARGNYARAMIHFTSLKPLSPNPEAVDKQIQELREKAKS